MFAQAAPLVLVSGFGPFEAVTDNPSGAVVADLERDPPRGLRVQGAVLPVSFGRAPMAWDEFQALHPAPALLLGLGVAREPGFRLERSAGSVLRDVPRTDVDGRRAAEFSRAGEHRCTSIDLEILRRRLVQRGHPSARLSEDAGGYVCERIYHHLLGRAAELGVPALFVHLPPLVHARLEEQVGFVRALLEVGFQAPAVFASTDTDSL